MAGTLKIEEINEIKKLYPLYANIEVFVETGTNYGNTILGLYHYFRELHTIEIQESIYNNVAYKANSYGIQNIQFYLGDSAIILPDILNRIPDPVIFFLDGHFSQGDTGRGSSDTPLLDELKNIDKAHNKNSVIIIDDYRMFGTHRNEDWSDITEENILKCFPKDKINHHYVSNDRLILLLKEI
jgi:hypothetical protein